MPRFSRGFALMGPPFGGPARFGGRSARPRAVSPPTPYGRCGVPRLECAPPRFRAGAHNVLHCGICPLRIVALPDSVHDAFHVDRQFPHCGDKRELLRLAFGDQSFVEDF